MSDQAQSMRRYYRWHARVYDATRWAFLFGRDAPQVWLTAEGIAPRRILEVGCGTGVNLARLASAFPDAELTGVDVSADMLEKARRRLNDRARLIEQPYRGRLGGEDGFDLILISYALSMINPGWQQVLAAARDDLAEGGHIAVVDFHRTPSAAFARWMGVNHVRMAGELAPVLETLFRPRLCQERAAYGGLWRYLVFVGGR